MNPEEPVLDASALVALVFHEEGADTVAGLMRGAVTTTANLAEVIAVCLRRRYGMPPEEVHGRLVGAGLEIKPSTAEQAVRAGQLVDLSYQDRQQYSGRLSLADGLCIALAEDLRRTLVTSDTLWKTMENRFTVPVRLFRQPA